MQTTKRTAWEFLWYALYAFAGLGLEFLLLGVVEPMLFPGTEAAAYTAGQRIFHWSLTSLCWGLLAALLVLRARRCLAFSVRGRRPGPGGVAGAALLAALCVALNAWDWGTLKLLGEWQAKGGALFAFQYLYYLLEVGLVVLIVAFGQRFGEGLLGRESRFPFGGVLLCCTWGAVHILSRGSVSAGLGTMAFSLAYGGIYLLLGRDLRWAYAATALAFLV